MTRNQPQYPLPNQDPIHKTARTLLFPLRLLHSTLGLVIRILGAEDPVETLHRQARQSQEDQRR